MKDKKFDAVGPLTPFRVTNKWADALYWLRTILGSDKEALDVPIRFRYTVKTISDPVVVEAAVVWFSLHKTEIHRYDWQQLRDELGKLGFSITAKAGTGCVEYTVVEELEDE